VLVSSVGEATTGQQQGHCFRPDGDTVSQNNSASVVDGSNDMENACNSTIEVSANASLAEATRGITVDNVSGVVTVGADGTQVEEPRSTVVDAEQLLSPDNNPQMSDFSLSQTGSQSEQQTAMVSGDSQHVAGQTAATCGSSVLPAEELDNSSSFSEMVVINGSLLSSSTEVIPESERGSEALPGTQETRRGSIF
jgi:hypothetical protein